jgi:NitT/TauT family transport system ATP-binding protein
MVAQSVDLNKVSMVFKTRAGEIQALTEVSLSIGEGEFVSLLGPSGCGKTTLLKVAAGLVKPTAGQAKISDKPVDRPQTDIGIVFQNPILLEWRRVLDNLLIQVEARKLPKEKYRDRAMELLASVGLAGFENAYPFELSGGMSQRVSVCRALIHDPGLLLMDEPFGALDALTRDQMMVDLQRLWLRGRKTVMFVTHSVSEAVFLSDRIVVMTPRPGSVSRVINVDLPRPRRLSMRSSDAFNRHQMAILALFESMGVLKEDEGDDDDDAYGVGNRRIPSLDAAAAKSS